MNKCVRIAMILCMVAFISCQDRNKQSQNTAQTPEFRQSVQSTPDLKPLVQQLIAECLNTRDAKKVKKFYASNVVFYNIAGAEHHGHDAIAMVINEAAKNYPVITYTIQDMIQEGNKISVRWVGEADDESMATLHGLTLLSYNENHKIEELWQEWSFADVVQ